MCTVQCSYPNRNNKIDEHKKPKRNIKYIKKELIGKSENCVYRTRFNLKHPYSLFFCVVSAFVPYAVSNTIVYFTV